MSSMSASATGHKAKKDHVEQGYSMPDRERSTSSLIRSLRNGRGLELPGLHLLMSKETIRRLSVSALDSSIAIEI